MGSVADQVATLLAASHAAHSRYRSFRPRHSPGSPNVVHGDDLKARDALLQALHAREQAAALDPDQTAPAWKDEVEHVELLAFYRQQLTYLNP